MTMKTKLSRYTAALGAVWTACLILLAAGYILFYAPQKANLIGLQTQYRQSCIELDEAKLAASAETRESMQARYEQQNQLIADFSTDADAETELVFQVGQIASQLQLGEFSSKHLKQKSHSTVDKSKILKEGWLEIECSATFEQFAQFVNQLERNHPVVFIEEVYFRRSPENNEGHDVKLQLSFLLKTETNKSAVAMATD